MTHSWDVLSVAHSSEVNNVLHTQKITALIKEDTEKIISASSGAEVGSQRGERYEDREEESVVHYSEL